MLLTSQVNRCVCKKQFTTNTAYLNHANTCHLARAHTEKATTGLSRLAARLRQNTAPKQAKGLESQRKPKEAPQNDKSDRALQILKRKLVDGPGSSISTEGTKPKRNRMSLGPPDLDSSTSGTCLRRIML